MRIRVYHPRDWQRKAFYLWSQVRSVLQDSLKGVLPGEQMH